MIDAVADALLRGKRFLVTSHLSPDGDAIGSLLAMARLLEDNGREAVRFHPEPVPGPYAFLDGADRVESDATAVDGHFDGIVVLDVGERDRIAAELPAGAGGAPFIVIDHHMVHGELGDVTWRRPAAAVGEMIAELARHLKWEVSTEFAEAAYTALLADTGSFRYSSTSSSALEAAAWLVGLGVQPWKVASHVYESWPGTRILLLGDVLSSLEVECEGRLACMVVTQESLANRGASVDMSEGFVNYGRMVVGVEVSALLRELGPDRYRLSLRSRGKIDVATIALKLGGGGHRNAAGATLEGSLEEVRSGVVAIVGEAIGEADLETDDHWAKR